MRLASAVAYNIRLQFRHGFYYAYLFFSVLYIVILRLLPPGTRETVAVLLIFTDPAMLGIVFIGGIVYLEKDENSLACLFTTPLRKGEYYLSKIISLTLISLLTAGAIAIAGTGRLGLNWFSLIPGVILTSGLFVLFGLAIVGRCDSVVSYMITAAPILIVSAAPLLNYFGAVDWPWLYIIPTQSSLILIRGAFVPNPALLREFLISCGVLSAWNAAAWFWADRWFTRFVIKGRIKK